MHSCTRDCGHWNAAHFKYNNYGTFCCGRRTRSLRGLMHSSPSGRFPSRKVNTSGLQRSNHCMHFCSHMNFYAFTLADHEFATFSLLASTKGMRMRKAPGNSYHISWLNLHHISWLRSVLQEGDNLNIQVPIPCTSNIIYSNFFLEAHTETTGKTIHFTYY